MLVKEILNKAELITFLVIAATSFTGCGKKKKSESSSNIRACAAAEAVNCTLNAKGCAQTFTGSTISPQLNEGTYVGVAFTLGSTISKNDGSESETVVVDNSSQLSLSKTRFIADEIDLNHLKVVIANRFSRDANSSDEIWSLIKEYEKFAADTKFSEENLLSIYTTESKKKDIPNLNLATTSCPSGAVDLGIFGGVITPVVTDGAGVCLLEVSSVVGSVSKAEVLSWSDKVMSSYLEIFGNMPDIGGFSMRPWVVLMNASSVPTISGTLGAFVRAPSESNGRPILIINTAAINSSSSRNDILGTIAHELYHGISYYYKVTKAKKSLETTAIDEGLAHVFEDIFGNSALIESNWGQSFLGAALDGLYPVLNSWSGTFDVKGARGGAHSFLYYLADRAGGFKAGSSGVTGQGVQCLKEIITSPAIGVANLETVSGDSMKNLIGDFISSVVMDQFNYPLGSDRWRLGDKFSFPSITGAKVSFGHRFIYNYQTLSELGSSDIESPYYAFNGFIWKQSGSKKLSLASSAENFGLTLVRTE